MQIFYENSYFTLILVAMYNDYLLNAFAKFCINTSKMIKVHVINRTVFSEITASVKLFTVN